MKNPEINYKDERERERERDLMNEVTHSREFVAGVADEHTGFTNGAITNRHAFYEL